jgi:cytochrome c biogenesis protein CcmG/thiol:disulfide interchange protein DsbE
MMAVCAISHEAPMSHDTSKPVSSPEQQRYGLWFWLLLGIVALVAIGLLQYRAERSNPEKSSLVGHRLPQLELEPLTGAKRSIGLDDLTGHVTLMDFWGTWCPPCRQELPHLAVLAAKHKDAPGFQVFAVSCGGAGREDIDELRANTTEFLQDRQLDLPTYADPQGFTRMGIEMIGGFEGYPTTLVIDRQGMIRGAWLGYRPGDERDIGRVVAEVLNEGAAGDTNPKR